MATGSKQMQRGQAIVLVALMILVLFGFVGLAIDSGRAYLDRRHLQAAADAAALAAAYNYMNTTDYSQAEQIAEQTYASNEDLYGTQSCSGLGTLTVSCTFGDPWGQLLNIDVTNKSIAGVSFAVTVTHSIPVAIMQVLGSGPMITIAAAATAVARKAGTNGAAIQTLSPAKCDGTNGNSLTFTGTSTTMVTGDVWANGSITDNGVASGTINGNAIDICPGMPPSPLPNFTVSGTQANGWTLPDPNYTEPTLDTDSQTWSSTNGATESPGTYSADPRITSGSPCYFLSAGVYDFSAGFTQNAGFISNELRPPDEPSISTGNQPNLTTTTSSLGGSISSIAVSSLPAAVAGSTSQHSSYVSVGGQTFVVASTGAAASAGPTSIPLNSPAQAVSGTIPSGSWLAVRSYYQFWDSNQSSPDAKGCSATFTPTTTVSDLSNPPVNAQTWAVEVTAVRWSANPTGTTCTGPPATPTCYLRESAPSMCKTVAVGSNQVIKISVSTPNGSVSRPDPGAQDYNVYLAPSGSCQGPFGYAIEFSNGGSSGTTINGSTLYGWSLNPNGALDTSGAPPPDMERLPAASGLPNANPAPSTPPHGDLGNENHCVDPTSGNNVVCPSSWTPGAVELFIPGGGNNQTCLNLQGGGDIYIFSGYQYGRILLYEPGPEQTPPANTCSNNVAGSGITSLIGIFYVPAANVTIIGNSSYLATIAGGVIAWTASIRGNGGVSITADPTLRTWPPSVTLTQ
jgi:Flp pilus assembly protein TadG